MIFLGPSSVPLNESILYYQDKTENSNSNRVKYEKFVKANKQTTEDMLPQAEENYLCHFISE